MTATVASTLGMDPPGPRETPLLGSMRPLLKDNLRFGLDMADRYGEVCVYRLGPMPIYQVNHPDGLQRILQENNHNYTKDTYGLAILRILVGRGLLTSDGDFWLRQRRLMQPALHQRQIAAWGEMMVAAAEELLDRWEGLPDGASVAVQPEMMRLTLDIVTQALFSSRIALDTQDLHHLLSQLLDDLTFRFLRPYYPPPAVPTRRNRRMWRALRQLEGVIYDLIGRRRAALARDEEVPADLLTTLLTARDEATGEGMTDRQLRDEVMTLFLAGHETTALLLTWIWHLLSTHPAVSRRLQAELDTVLAGRAPTMADLPQLVYARMIVDETLRLYPPAWISNRQSVEADVVCGYRIPADAFVAFSPYVMHRLPAYWPNPEGFDPERFAPGQEKSRPRYAYVPFGAGPRLCIGNRFALVEATLVLAAIARKVTLHRLPGQGATPQGLLTLRPAEEMRLALYRR